MTEQVTKLAKSSKTDEHHTPEWILSFAREAMNVDQFYLDPATTTDNPTKAKRIYTEEDNGLNFDWRGDVWVNPPFSLNKEFALKVANDKNVYNQCIYLAKADFRTRWSKTLLSNADHMIIINDYVKFKGSSHSAVFSVVLYCFKVHPYYLRKAIDNSDKNLILTEL